MPHKIESKKDAEAFVDAYDTFLFDCDGVLWRGDELVPHSKETIELLRSKGKQLVFVTNNSTKSRKQYVNKFKKLGLDVKAEEIFGSSYSSAVYLDKSGFDKKNKKVLAIGEQGLVEELEDVGFQTVGGTDPSLWKEFSFTDDVTSIQRQPEIGAVVCGFDSHINYRKLALSQAQLVDPDVIFLATNIDSTFPTAGRLLPGAGTVVKAVSYCADREPDAILGKPSKEMMDCIETNFKFDPKRTVMVGDRLNTDITFGLNSNLGTLFVLSGVDSLESCKKSGVEPKFYADKLGDVYELLS